MDEEGSKIQASVAGNYLVKYGKLLQEKRCVLVSKFEIGDNLSPYRLTNHPHKLFFNFTTDIMNGDDFGGSIHGFSFTSFDVLRNHAIPPDSHVGTLMFMSLCGEIMRCKCQSLWKRILCDTAVWKI
ncbi:uncharacterized protein LOC118481292 isoform X2 [Helianthus annuus]|uniref:uncharacterized protein LOC118481292 isoform X2 n=1 Tax=Helianthus annuus TaxID=4232 RepID=UPI001652EDBA|nr:uncharacterized protein LOC118481292 isoform X2 [Helianthus annuus]